METEPVGVAKRLQQVVLDALTAGDDIVGEWATDILVRIPPPDLNDRLFDLLAARKSVVPVVNMLSRTARKDPRLIPLLDATAMDVRLSDIERGAAATAIGCVLGLSGLPGTYRESGRWWREHRKHHLGKPVMKISIGIVTVLVVTAIIAWALLRNMQAMQTASNIPFSMPIDDVLAVKTKGNVVVVGVIATGEVLPGSALLVNVGDSSISVTVEGLEAFHKPLKSAKAGDRVSIMLQGVDKEQVTLPATLVDGD